MPMQLESFPRTGGAVPRLDLGHLNHDDMNPGMALDLVLQTGLRMETISMVQVMLS